MQKLSRFLKERPYKTGFIIIILAAVSFFVFRGGKEFDFDLAEAARGNLINEINVTGRVKAAEEVDLGFERSGRVAAVQVKEGERVYSGQVLVRLENGSLLADLEKAEANLKADQATLIEFQRGSRPEEITVQETKITNAESSLREAKRALLDEIRKSFTSADDAIRNKIDLLFSNPRSSNPELNVSSPSAQLKIDLEFERIIIEGILNNWQTAAAALTINDDVAEAGGDAEYNLGKIDNFLSKMALLVNSLEAGANLSQTVIDSYKADVSSARSGINTALSNLSVDNKGLVDANSLLLLEKENLNLMLSGGDPQKVLAQEAKIDGAQADIKKIQAELRGTLIISPIDGVVTKQEARIGELVTSGATPVSVISDKKLQVEVNIPETDVVSIISGNPVRINLDAYSRDINFPGKVVSVNPGEILLQGVPAYKTTIEFDEDDERIRSGMTADLFILTDTKENILNIPRRAVLKDDSREYVRMFNEGGEIVERDVITGFKSSDGRIEILEGLEEGEEVIVFLEE